MRKNILCFLSFFIVISFFSCTSSETVPPYRVFEEIEKSYGTLPPGLLFDSRANEWEEHYLDANVIESIFGDEKEYREAVESAYLYLSASLVSYEELIVLECYTSDKARFMAGLFSERNRTLATFEENPLEARIVCKGRTVIYCRLANTSIAKEAVRKIER